jgi:hypothetical protein
MIRTIIVTLAAICLTLLLLSFGTAVVLNTTEFGKVAAGHTESVADPWKTFYQGQTIFFWYVDLPTTLIVGLLTATFAKRLSIISAVIATSPLPALMLVAGDVWKGFILIICAVVVALVPVWARRERERRSKHEKQIAGNHSN